MNERRPTIAAIWKDILPAFDNPEVRLRKWEVRRLRAAISLFKPARDAFLGKICHPNPRVRHLLVRLLRLSYDRPGVWEAVLPMLGDPDSGLASAVVALLRRTIRFNPAACRAVIAKLNDPEGNVRFAACDVLQVQAAYSVEIREALVAKFQDSIVEIRWYAAHILKSALVINLDQKPQSPLDGFPHTEEILLKLLARDSTKRSRVLQNLRFFWAFANCESFSEAAEVLGLDSGFWVTNATGMFGTMSSGWLRCLAWIIHLCAVFSAWQTYAGSGSDLPKPVWRLRAGCKCSPNSSKSCRWIEPTRDL